MSYIGKVKDTAGNTHLVGSTLYGTCSTAAGTAAKAVTCADFDSLVSGVTIHVKFSNGSSTTSNMTLNVNSMGVKNVLNAGNCVLDQNAVAAFTYDGTAWVYNGPHRVVNTDTENTAGIYQSSNKLYLVGSETTSAGSIADSDVTFTNSDLYATDGALHANSFNGVSMAAVDGIGVSIGTPTYSVQLNEGDSFVLDDACAKAVDNSIASGSTSTNLPTSQAVANYVDSAVSTATSGALSYHGVATALTDITDTNYKKGWYWMVGTNPSITIDGVTCETGDMIIAQQNKTAGTTDQNLDVIQTNIEALTTAEIDALWAAA